MREEFISYLKEKAFKDPRFILLTADLGFGIFDDFEIKYPKQFINVGIAEQLMSSLACGLASEGLRPVSYSIGNFPTLRALEQIRNDIIYHNSNVKIVTNGAGFSYGTSGMSHHATEDIGVIRSLPRSLIFSPASSYECSSLIDLFFSNQGFGYLRLDKTSSNLIPIKIKNTFNPVLYHKGSESSILLMSHGSTLSLYEDLLEDTTVNKYITILSVPFLVRTNYLSQILMNNKYIITTEEHQISCGFGSFIAELIVDEHFENRLFRYGLSSGFSEEVGSQSYLRSRYLPSKSELKSKIKELIGFL
tara:strand:+ start:603 stop:1517 length:915 start_codon:yes stop_codon:yes gene_type:complete